MNKGNRETIELFLILVIVILLITTIFFVSKTIELMYYNDTALVNTIMDKKWYSYDEDNYYETFEIMSDRSIKYSYKDNLNNNGRFEKCNLLLYTINNNSFKIMCGTEIKKVTINLVTEHELVLLVDGNKIKYMQHFDN